MTLEYHLAELIQRAATSDREAVLRQALDQYEKFLTRLDEYELLSPGDKRLFVQYMANPTTFTLAPTSDAAARRDIKVRRFREEKELKQKLEVGILFPKEQFFCLANRYTVSIPQRSKSTKRRRRYPETLSSRTSTLYPPDIPSTGPYDARARDAVHDAACTAAYPSATR